ncbi:MAG: chromosome segregation protein ScpA [Thermoplasmatota archaeon]
MSGAGAPAASKLSETEVVNHLLFHKALIADDEDTTRINQYLALVKQQTEGEHVSIPDPFDKSIAIAFELVLDEHLDPWRIDLLQFAKLYVRRLKEKREVDLITAGRLLLMAWKILKLQSEDTASRAEPPPPLEAPLEWDEIPEINPLTAEEAAYAYTTAVLEQGAVPIDEKVRHKGDRKVTFMELLDALEEARKEAELRATLVAEREALKAQRKVAKAERVEGQLHKEDQEADIAEVWQRITGENGHPIPIRDLQAPNRADIVKTLVSVLFLARANRIRLWQENFPYGPIYVQNPTAPGFVDKSPPAPTPPMLELKARVQFGGKVSKKTKAPASLGAN